MKREVIISQTLNDLGITLDVKAVPLVRCRECKYAHLTYDGDCEQCDKWVDDEGFLLTLYLDGDFYCGYAERRNDDRE